MATNTYVALAEYTLASNGGTVTFSNISQQYRDLRLVVKGGFADSGFLLGARVGNSSVSTTGYAYTAMRGNGSSATSAHKTDMVFGAICQQGGNDLNNLITVDFMNYSNTTTQKTWIARYGNGGEGTDSVVSTWRSTAAIDTIAIAECGDGGSGAFNYGNMLAGTTFTLYGIGGVGGELAPKALGGEVFSDADYYYHLYRGAGTFQPLQSLTADILVVAGGGGSSGAGGGAGAGGLLGFASQSLTAQAYPVFVGAGGARGVNTNIEPSNGSNSKFGTLTTAIGGGRGAGYVGGANYFSANTGGSGGGGAYNAAGQYASGTTGQGNAGNNGYQDPGGGAPRSGGGGGGAGGAATNGGVANTGGNGGVGATNGSTVGGTAGPYNFINAMGAATGTGQLSAGNYYYAGGGGGSGKNTRGSGGLGGGGYGGTDEPAAAGIGGTANTGGGAGNTGGTYTGFNGGSGVVIVRYAK